MKTLTIAAALLALAATAWADEAAIKIKDGPNRDLVAANCSICHSLDYLGMNSPFQDRKAWEATVTKMMKLLGAPLTQDDMPKVVDYLVQNYGKS